MSEQQETIDRLAQQVKIALESDDLSAFSGLLDPNGLRTHPDMCAGRPAIVIVFLHADWLR